MKQTAIKTLRVMANMGIRRAIQFALLKSPKFGERNSPTLNHNIANHSSESPQSFIKIL
jgi:hypothetical protein